MPKTKFSTFIGEPNLSKMIAFLRKIRKTLIQNDKVKSYVLYAIGEILLIVIGILLAVNINNWNQNRQNAKKLNNIMLEIEENLLVDQAFLEQIMSTNQSFIERVQVIELRNRQLSNDSLYQSVSDLHVVVGFLPVTFGFDKLSNQSFASILPDSVVNRLNLYYSSYSNDALNNTSYESLSKYSLDKLRDYLIKHGYPIDGSGQLAPPNNITDLKAIVSSDEFIGILRNTQHSRYIQQLGFNHASNEVNECLEMVRSYLQQERN